MTTTVPAPADAKPSVSPFAAYLARRLDEERIADYQGYVTWILTECVRFGGRAA